MGIKNGVPPSIKYKLTNMSFFDNIYHLLEA